MINVKARKEEKLGSLKKSGTNLFQEHRAASGENWSEGKLSWEKWLQR